VGSGNGEVATDGDAVEFFDGSDLLQQRGRGVGE
jgi:hypothetical protein